MFLVRSRQILHLALLVFVSRSLNNSFLGIFRVASLFICQGSSPLSHKIPRLRRISHFVKGYRHISHSFVKTYLNGEGGI